MRLGVSFKPKLRITVMLFPVCSPSNLFHSLGIRLKQCESRVLRIESLEYKNTHHCFLKRISFFYFIYFRQWLANFKKRSKNLLLIGDTVLSKLFSKYYLFYIFSLTFLSLYLEKLVNILIKNISNLNILNYMY